MGNSHVAQIAPEDDNYEDLEAHSYGTRSRIPFLAPHKRGELAYTARWHARHNADNIYGALLSTLEGWSNQDQIEHCGASHYTLHRVADGVGMTDEERWDWISLVESLPLSEHLAQVILQAVTASPTETLELVP